MKSQKFFILIGSIVVQWVSVWSSRIAQSCGWFRAFMAMICMRSIIITRLIGHFVVRRCLFLMLYFLIQRRVLLFFFNTNPIFYYLSQNLFLGFPLSDFYNKLLYYIVF